MFTPLHRMYLVGFLLDFAIMVGITATPFYLYGHLGGDETMSGYILGTQMISYSLGCIVFSRYVARVRNGLWCALAGIALFTVSYSIMPLLRNPYACGVVSVISNLALALVWPSLHDWVGGEPDSQQRKRYIGWFNVAWSSGFTVSPIAGGWLYSMGYRAPFAVLFAMGVVCFLLVWSLPRARTYFGAHPETLTEERAEHDRASTAFLWTAWTAVFVANALVGVTRSIYPKRVETLLHDGSLTLLGDWPLPAFLATDPVLPYSVASSCLSLMTALCFLLLGRTHFWRHRIGALFGVQVVGAAAFWWLGRTTSLLVMLLCFAAVGTALGMAFFSSVYYSLAEPAHKHRRAAINEGSVGMGGFIGSVAFGYAIQQYGDMRIPFTYTPLFILLAIGAQWLMLHRRTRATR